MSVIEQIVKVIGNSRELTSGYGTFSARDLDQLRVLLHGLKEEIKSELKEELNK